MRALIQRVREASVAVGGQRTAAIGPGLLLLAGVAPADTIAECEWIARKVVALRIFDDDAGVMNRSVRDVGGELLAVSQFTLYASTRKGARPSYSAAAAPDAARPVFDALVRSLARELGREVPSGVFGAMMQVALVNDGPVTIWIDSATRD
ncbi:MAG TPA: D-aminoacyl-tRNA deacylase [Casimicrobiaceae bacterium]|nr:D-aminoacyl-tRNA deacylase [Casimicrobiaceae bacterium]